MESLGRHLLVELYGCRADALDDCALVEAALADAAEQAGATLVGRVFHRFQPAGVSGVVLIAESHLTIHTWPELGYAAVDLFTCGVAVDPYAAVAQLQQALDASHTSTVEMKRGQLRDIRGSRRSDI